MILIRFFNKQRLRYCAQHTILLILLSNTNPSLACCLINKH